jgi:hypothetical protein
MMTRFARYIEKVFDFSASLATLEDSRAKPQIPTASVWTSAFVLFVTRLGSLNALESELRVPGRLEGLVGRRKPSADTIGRIMGEIFSWSLRGILRGLNHRLRRNKALDDNPWALRFAVVDGHEFFSQ